jgi:hypothetical protein
VIEWEQRVRTESENREWEVSENWVKTSLHCLGYMEWCKDTGGCTGKYRCMECRENNKMLWQDQITVTDSNLVKLAQLAWWFAKSSERVSVDWLVHGTRARSVFADGSIKVLKTFCGQNLLTKSDHKMAVKRLNMYLVHFSRKCPFRAVLDYCTHSLALPARYGRSPAHIPSIH